MPKTIYYTGTTLDGFIADPDDSLDWLITREIDMDGPLGFNPFIREVGALAMGATTYEWIRGHLGRTGDGWSYEAPCWVFTHRELEAIAGADIRFTRADVGEVHAEMAAAGGGRDRWIVGGGDLVGQFADRGLLDELIVGIAPATLGAGAPLLPRRLDLELVELARNGEFACARYAVRYAHQGAR